MRKHHRRPAILALALLAAATGASAQSNVALSGRVDLNLGRDIGGAATRLGTGAMSHLAFTGSEDLGGGQQAFFKLQTRINADTGTVNTPGAVLNTPAGTYWSQESSVGLRGGWGSLTLGRQMTAALLAQILADPWFWDNTTAMFAASTGLVGNLWYNDAITYAVGSGPFSFSAQVAGKAENPGWAGAGRRTPYSFSLGYAPGPWQLRLGHERPGDGQSRWTTLFGGWDFGRFTLNGQVGSGEDTAGAAVRSWLVSTVVPVGAGQIRAAYGEYRNAGVTRSEKAALGYYHYLSKRTAVYANVAHDGKATTRKTGYELGLQHHF